MTQAGVGIIHGNAKAVYQIGAQLRGLHRFRREFSPGGDEPDAPVIDPATRIGTDLYPGSRNNLR